MFRHKIVAALVEALIQAGGRPYPLPPTGTLTVIAGNGVARTYQVEVVAEKNGAWIVRHKRPSGFWDRTDRSRHVGQGDKSSE